MPAELLHAQFGNVTKPARVALANNGTPFRIENRPAVSLAATALVNRSAVESILLSPDGTHYATVHRHGDLEREVELWEIGKANPSYQWVVTSISTPLAFSANSAFLAFPNGDPVIVASVVDGTTRTSLPAGLNEITAIAVDDSGAAVLVYGWKPDQSVVIRKNYVVKTLPTTGDSMFQRSYVVTDKDPEIRDLAIDVNSGLIAMGGGRYAWVRARPIKSQFKGTQRRDSS